MPRLIYAPRALADLVRLRKYFHARNPEAAKRAMVAIKTAIKSIEIQPDRFRPALDMIGYRELIIDFGANGYVARFQQRAGDEILIARIRHQLENDYPN